MAKLQFFMYDMTYKVKGDKSLIYLFGRSTEGKRVIVVDDSFQPYFLIQESNRSNRDQLIKELENLEIEGEKKVTHITKCIKKEQGKDLELLKVHVLTPKTASLIARQARNLNGVEEVLEFDIPFPRRYIIDNSLTPLTLLEAEGEFVENTNRVDTFKTNKVSQLEESTIQDPRILAFDIETYNPEGKAIRPEKNPIIMISFYGKDFEKVITWKRFPTDKDYIEFVEGEEELLERFKEIINSYKPEFITGYFSDGFDFPYIATRAKKYKIKLDIGLDRSDAIINKRDDSKARIKGIVHIDIFKFIKKVISRTMKTQRYNLDSVAEELLGKKKEDVDLDNLAKVWDECSEELEKFCYYNLVDSLLAYELMEKVMPNILELSKMVRVLPFNSTRKGFGQLVESYLMYLTKEYNEIIPSKPSGDKVRGRIDKRYQGAFVYTPQPGVYENLVVLDFRSLYPSIISAHNISADTLNCECCDSNNLVPGLENDYIYCEKRKGFIPHVIDNLISRRMRVKEIIKQKERKDAVLFARSDTLKLLANSLYGYYGFFGSRWYSWECAESITAWARFYIQRLIKKAEEAGYKVIYGDTDSVFLLLGEKTISDVKKFTSEINKDLPGLMELEYESHFKRGIFVETRSGKGGAKKKYALISENNEIKITGFATVRRNWSPIAKKTQKEIINILLKENDAKKALDYIRTVITDLKDHTIDIQEVLIRTRLQKDIGDYVQIGPHVAVAKRMKLKGEYVGPGTAIEYVIVEGGKMIRDRARLLTEMGQEKYDANYYIDHQILPSVESLMQVYGFSLDHIKMGHSQSGLSDFF